MSIDVVELLARPLDQALGMFRSFALGGEQALALLPGASLALAADILSFMGRVRAGEAGVNEGGTLVAMKVEDLMVVCRLGYGFAQPPHKPRIVLGTIEPDAMFFGDPDPRKLPP